MAEEISGLQVFVKDGKVQCPNRDCRVVYRAERRDRPQRVNCPDCGMEYLIITPPDELPRTGLAQRSEVLLPRVKNLLTSTVMLRREGNERQPKVALHMPAASQLQTVAASGGVVACPQCGSDFAVAETEYGQPAECSKCHCQFRISG